MTVLILAREIEPQVDRVVAELTRRDVPVFRTDLAAFPQRLTLNARLGANGWRGTLATERRSVRLADIRSIWYRHPSHFELAEGMSRPELRHAAVEARVGVSGVLSSLDVLWVNYPSREADALKPRQLDVARRCGLRIPETRVTNTPAGVREFAAEIGGPLAGKNLTAASLIESGRVQTAYTRRLEPADLMDLSGVDKTALSAPSRPQHDSSSDEEIVGSERRRPWSRCRAGAPEWAVVGWPVVHRGRGRGVGGGVVHRGPLVRVHPGRDRGRGCAAEVHCRCPAGAGRPAAL